MRHVLAAALATCASCSVWSHGAASADAPVFQSPSVSIAVESDESERAVLGRIVLAITNNDSIRGLCVPTGDLLELAPQVSKFRVTDSNGLQLKPLLFEGLMGPASDPTFEWIGPGFSLVRLIDLDATFVAPESLGAIKLSWQSQAFPCVRKRRGRNSEIIIRIAQAVAIGVDFKLPEIVQPGTAN